MTELLAFALRIFSFNDGARSAKNSTNSTITDQEWSTTLDRYISFHGEEATDVLKRFDVYEK